MRHFYSFAKLISQSIFCRQFAIVLTLVFAAFNSSANQIRNITVLAEPNMAQALAKIARVYSQKNAVIVSISFDSATNLIEEITDGEPADIFISANQKWTNLLRQQGLIDIYSINHIANDYLVLARSKKHENSSDLFKEQIQFDKAIATIGAENLDLIIDSKETSLGNYSADILRFFQIGNVKIHKKLSEDKSSIEDYLNNNKNSYGILFASQAVNNNLQILSKEKDQIVFYQALVIAGDNMEIAREFVKFLKTDQVKKIFQESGFVFE